MSYLIGGKELMRDAESFGAVDRLPVEGRALPVSIGVVGGIEQDKAAVLDQ